MEVLVSYSIFFGQEEQPHMTPNHGKNNGLGGVWGCGGVESNIKGGLNTGWASGRLDSNKLPQSTFELVYLYQPSGTLISSYLSTLKQVAPQMLSSHCHFVNLLGELKSKASFISHPLIHIWPGHAREIDPVQSTLGNMLVVTGLSQGRGLCWPWLNSSSSGAVREWVNVSHCKNTVKCFG